VFYLIADGHKFDFELLINRNIEWRLLKENLRHAMRLMFL
jgi:hypothetical protein